MSDIDGPVCRECGNGDHSGHVPNIGNVCIGCSCGWRGEVTEGDDAKVIPFDRRAPVVAPEEDGCTGSVHSPASNPGCVFAPKPTPADRAGRFLGKTPTVEPVGELRSPTRYYTGQNGDAELLLTIWGPDLATLAVRPVGGRTWGPPVELRGGDGWG